MPHPSDTLEPTAADAFVRPPWTAWLAGVVALLIIVGTVGDAVAPDQEKASGVVIRISRDDGSKIDAAELLSAEELHAIFSHVPGDPEGFRAALRAHRASINLMLIARSANRRAAWATTVERALTWFSLLCLVFLLGPLVVYRRTRPTGAPVRRAFYSSPYFAVATAGTMLVLTVLPSMIIQLQSLQLGLAATGSLDVALSDATMHMLIYEQSPALEQLLGRLGGLETLALRDPAEAFALLQHLWRATGEARTSWLFTTTAELMGSLSFVVDFYGPALALVTLVLVGRILGPVLRNTLAYPGQLVNGDPVEGAGRFLWGQLELVWTELRIAMWLFVFMLVITVSAVVLVRAAAFPVAWMLIEALSAALRAVAAGQPLPDVRLFFAALSMAVGLASVTLFCVVPAGFLLSRVQWVLRTRHTESRRFRDFPAFWAVVRGVVAHVVVPTVLAFAAGVATYMAIAALAPLAWRLFLPAVVGPVMVVVLWYTRVVPQARRLARVDVLSAGSAR